MKVFESVLVALLARGAAARPATMDEGDTLPETSRVTAFVISPEGKPTVQCWEFSNMINDQKVTRADGSVGTARTLKIASGGELEGLDIMTWPADVPIWPLTSGDDLQADFIDLSALKNLFSLQSGLISVKVKPQKSSNDRTFEYVDNDVNIFQLENGDDWFYFEDKYDGGYLSRSSDAPESPISISAISSTETEVLRLTFKDRPAFKVLHDGACRFTGIKVPAEDSSRRSAHVRRPLTVQQHRNSDL